MHDLTAEVSELYEDYPYPGHGVVSALVANLVAKPLAALQAQLGRERLRVLDAGCGTGEQTIGLLRAHSKLDVTGIDLNRASLEMAKKLANKHSLKLAFERRNLMQPIAGLGRFDVIVSVGTLHHLAEPRAGFEHLRALAEPHTVFLGMVYNAFGKWEMLQIRDALNLLAPSRDARLDILRHAKLATNTGLAHYLKLFAQRRRFGPDTPWREAVQRVIAGRSRAYQADAFTHVQEACFTALELAEMLDQTGWVFNGWPERSGLPDRPEQFLPPAYAPLLRAKSRLEQVAIYERLIRPLCFYFLASPKP